MRLNSAKMPRSVVLPLEQIPESTEMQVEPQCSRCAKNPVQSISQKTTLNELVSSEQTPKDKDLSRNLQLELRSSCRAKDICAVVNKRKILTFPIQ